MSKGVPACGYRVRKDGTKLYIGANRHLNKMVQGATMKDDVPVATPVANNVIPIATHPQHHVHHASTEAVEDIERRIADRFEIVKTLSDSCFLQDTRSLIVTGPPGLGKSHTVLQVIKEWDQDGDKSTVIKGYVRAPGLVKMLYHYRHAGNVIVFDDADSIFNDETALNYLKAACDTTDEREISVLSEYKLVDEESAELIPRKFRFDGAIIFISNYDFDAMIKSRHKFTPHFEALMSRSLYIDCGMKTIEDYVVRIKQVIREGLFENMNWAEQSDIIGFIEDNKNHLRELSIRMAVKLAGLRKTYGNDWKRVARITMFKH